jgi:tetratricopeptide (TPR) repeat protein
VLYQVLTGKLPYDVSKAGIYEATRIVREQQPKRVSTIDRTLRGDVETIVLHALAKDRDRRYQSAIELAHDIERYLSRRPIRARPPSLVYSCKTFVKRNKLLVGAVAAVFLALVFGIFGTSWQAHRAVTQRDRAENMFNQVRELARTFMFDFHDRIEGLDGSLPARELLVDTALEYLDGLAQEAHDRPDLMREVAAAYERVGDIRGGLRHEHVGDTEGALANYRTAAAMRERLLAASPDDVGLLADSSQGLIKIGDILERTGDAAGAVESYRQALAIRRRLAEADRTNRRGLPLALNEMGTALVRTGRLSEAREYYEESLNIGKQLAAEQPENAKFQRDLSVVYIRGQYDLAASRYEEAVRIRTTLLESDPDSGKARRDVAVAHYFLGQALLKLEQPDRAMESLRYFLAVSEQRVEANPKSKRAVRDLAAALEMVGRAAAMAGDHDRARESYERFRSLIVPLSDSDPDNTHLREFVARSHQRLAELAAKKGAAASAVRNYREALLIVESLVRADPDNIELQVYQAKLLAGLGGALALTDDREGARRRLESARTLYETLRETQPEKAELREGLEQTLDRLSGLDAGARAGDAAPRP